jgi:hypothetical protein
MSSPVPPLSAGESDDGSRPVIEGQDRDDLVRAVDLLENPSFIARVTDVLGQPLERVVKALPSQTSDRLQESVRSALHRLLDISIRSLAKDERRAPSMVKHRIAGGVSGAVGGFFGAPALAVELPITTTIILRSIADIARSEGEPLDEVESRLACLEVFALGGRSGSDDGTETGYFAIRTALAKAVSDAARHIAQRGLTAEGAPVIARLITQIASRFGTVVSEKVATQAVPVVGAVGGAGINLLFMNHFQGVARGHFIIRRLERVHGREVVRREYQRVLEEGSSG